MSRRTRFAADCIYSLRVCSCRVDTSKRVNDDPTMDTTEASEELVMTAEEAPINYSIIACALHHCAPSALYWHPVRLVTWLLPPLLRRLCALKQLLLGTTYVTPTRLLLQSYSMCLSSVITCRRGLVYSEYAHNNMSNWPALISALLHCGISYLLPTFPSLRWCDQSQKVAHLLPQCCVAQFYAVVQLPVWRQAGVWDASK